MRKSEFESISQKEGQWEQSPTQILNTVKILLEDVKAYLLSNGYQLEQIAALGITNQRETIVCWDKNDGQPLYNAILWKDTRTHGIVEELAKSVDGVEFPYKEKTGLPISTYFSACKIKWLMENVDEVKRAYEEDRLMVGTVDTWLIWNLTGRQAYKTDVTNASRTMLMNIKTLEWDDQLCSHFGIDKNILAEICSSAEIYGYLNYEGSPFAELKSIPISGCLGDQQAALVGHQCFKKGMAKNTFGTGSFMLYNVGEDIVYSKEGLVTTVAYQFGREKKPVYALEGSIASAGDAVQMLVNLKMLKSAGELEELAKTEKDNGGVYFVPAFNGLLAPNWRPEAQSLMRGLNLNSRKGHACRAIIEAISFQIFEVLDVMKEDSGLDLHALYVDGGMTENELLMQTQADYLGIDVVKPDMVETTALGAAIAAAFTLGLWDNDLHETSQSNQIFRPQMETKIRDEKFMIWKDLVSKC